MAGDMPAAVGKVVATDTRIDATVILGASRVNLTINPRNPAFAQVKDAYDTLCEHLIELAKGDLAQQLELHLSPSVKKALTT